MENAGTLGSLYSGSSSFLIPRISSFRLSFPYRAAGTYETGTSSQRPAGYEASCYSGILKFWRTVLARDHPPQSSRHPHRHAVGAAIATLEKRTDPVSEYIRTERIKSFQFLILSRFARTPSPVVFLRLAHPSPPLSCVSMFILASPALYVVPTPNSPRRRDRTASKSADPSSGALDLEPPNTSVVWAAYASMLMDIPDDDSAAALRRLSRTRVQSALCTTRSGLQSRRQYLHGDEARTRSHLDQGSESPQGEHHHGEVRERKDCERLVRIGEIFRKGRAGVRTENDDVEKQPCRRSCKLAMMSDGMRIHGLTVSVHSSHQRAPRGASACD